MPDQVRHDEEQLVHGAMSGVQLLLDQLAADAIDERLPARLDGR